ncbi:beta-ketoacyl-ACP synthase III [Bacillus luti]|nr:3-oxoacyl-ACP synthase [Bacillus cereus]
MKRNIKIVGTGLYLPKRIVTSKELEEITGTKAEWINKVAGVHQRHYVVDETSSYMGAMALKDALKNANYTYEDLDAIICASGTAQQEIPCTAALVQEQMGQTMSGTPCFDINSTCLSFVTALDLMSHAVENGQYERIAIISSEIASVGLNYNQKESSVLFGDAACAVIIEKTTSGSHLIASHMETYSEGAHLTEIRGGGTMLHPRIYNEEIAHDFLFDMNGKGVFKLSLRLIDDYMKTLLGKSNLTIKDIDMVVPHQASGSALGLMRKKLGVEEDKFMNVLKDYGNTIASSIPLTLHLGIQQGRIKRGDTVLLLGTSAGLSLGGITFVY